jgi:hypothetical protein
MANKLDKVQMAKAIAGIILMAAVAALLFSLSKSIWEGKPVKGSVTVNGLGTADLSHGQVKQ